MKKLQPFLGKYEIVLFDMDGVITSERNYWHTAGLVVYELFGSEQYFGNTKMDIDYAMAHYEEITAQIFCGGKTISLLKNKGVNSNWDMVYVVACLMLIYDTRDFEQVYHYAGMLGDDILDEYENLGHRLAAATGRPLGWCERNGGLWQMGVDVFQEWYLGCGSKPGLISRETPLIPLETLKEIFTLLIADGKSLGFGTGRTAYEVEYPVKMWGFEEYFDKNRWISYDTVQAAEAALAAHGCEVTLTKPHPYVFLKGAYGLDYSDKKLIDGEYDRDLVPKVLVVGDAGADILSAQAMGADFCAVLTGISGQAARKYFEELQATYILDSVADFLVGA